MTATLIRPRARLFMGLAVQAASAGSNFLLVLMVSRSSSAEGFGRFALAYAVVGVAIGVARSATFEPLLFDRSDRPGPAAVLGTGAGIGLTIAAGLLAGAAWFGDASVAALGLVVPLVLINDGGRYIALGRSEHQNALRSDLVWLAIGLVVAVAGMGPVASILGWGFGAGIATVANRSLPSLDWRRGGLSVAFTASLAADYLIMAARGLILLVGLTVAFGPTAAAAVTIVQFAYQPLFTLAAGLRITYLRLLPTPEAERSPRTGWLLVGIGLGLGGVGALWGLGMAQIPPRLAAPAVGDSVWAAAPYLFSLCAFDVARLTELALTDVLRVGGDHRKLLALRASSLMLSGLIALLIATHTFPSLGVALAWRAGAAIVPLVVGAWFITARR